MGGFQKTFKNAKKLIEVLPKFLKDKLLIAKLMLISYTTSSSRWKENEPFIQFS